MTPAVVNLRRGRSPAAAASSSTVGSSPAHFTSLSVTSDGSNSSFAWASQRAVSSSTVSCRSTSRTAAYRAPSTSRRFTHTVAGAASATEAEWVSGRVRRTDRRTVKDLLRGRRVAGRVASDGVRRAGGGTPSAAASGHYKLRQELTKPHGAAPAHQRAGAHAGEGAAAAARRAQRRGRRVRARSEHGRPERYHPIPALIISIRALIRTKRGATSTSSAPRWSRTETLLRVSAALRRGRGRRTR